MTAATVAAPRNAQPRRSPRSMWVRPGGQRSVRGPAQARRSSPSAARTKRPRTAGRPKPSARSSYSPSGRSPIGSGAAPERVTGPRIARWAPGGSAASVSRPVAAAAGAPRTEAIAQVVIQIVMWRRRSMTCPSGQGLCDGEASGLKSRARIFSFESMACRLGREIPRASAASEMFPPVSCSASRIT